MILMSVLTTFLAVCIGVTALAMVFAESEDEWLAAWCGVLITKAVFVACLFLA